MDKKIVFVRTQMGEEEVNGQSDALYGDAKRVLLLIDNKANVAELTKRAPPSLHDTLKNKFQELLNGGYIKDKNTSKNISQPPVLKMASPAYKLVTPKTSVPSQPESSVLLPKMVMPSMPPLDLKNRELEDQSNSTDLDFSFMLPEVGKNKTDVDVPNVRELIEVAAKKRQDLSRSNTGKAAQFEGASKTAKLRSYDKAKEKAKLEVSERARTEAELRKKSEADSIQLKVAQEALKMRTELAEIQVKVEAEVRGRIEAETIIKKKVEAVRLQAERDAEKNRLEIEAENAKIELEARTRLEAEARAKAEIEARLKREAEVARLSLEKERTELEAIRVKAETEKLIREEAEIRVRAEVEKRIKQETESARLAIEKERAVLEAIRVKDEAEKKMRVETEIRVRAEVEKRTKQEAESARLAIEKERAVLEAIRIKNEAEKKMRVDAEMRVRAEVEKRIKQEEEAVRLLIERERAELARMKGEAETTQRAEVAARLKADDRTQHGDRRGTHQRSPGDSDGNSVSDDVAETDQAEKLRQSFVDSFVETKKDKNNGSLNFKLDTFSLANNGKVSTATTLSKNPDGPASNPSKLLEPKVNIDKREAEAQRVMLDQQAEKLKAHHEEVARAQVERQTAAARMRAEQELIAQRENDEALRLKSIQEAAQLQAVIEEEAQKLADQQTKQWEDAKLKALTQARAETERTDNKYAEAQIKSRYKRDRSNSRSLPIGKIVASLFALAVLAMVGLPYVWPLETYIAPLEIEMAAQLKQPVKIQKIHVALLPLPRLELMTVAIGLGEELKIGNVVLNFDWSALFAATKSINRLELRNVTVMGSSLDKVIIGFQEAGGNEKYPVAHIDFKGVRILSDDIDLPLLNGKADFDAQGKFVVAELKSEDEKFGIELKSLQNRLFLELNIRQSSLPILPNLKFTDLSVSGEVGNSEVFLSDFFAHIHGGALTGRGQLSWANGWRLQGEINAKSLELQSMFPDFSVIGQVYGDVNISMYGTALSQLDKAPQLEGTFEAKNGTFNKLDIEPIARVGLRQGKFGRTNFSQLLGTLKVDNGGQRYRLSKITAGAISGSGLFNIDANLQLSGQLQVKIKGGGNDAVVLQLSGTPAEPVLTPAR